jgi:hypothetical protein
MARNVLILNNPKVTFADTEAGLTTGDAFECQITSAMLTPQPVYNTIPATGCAGASQSPGRTGWQLDVAWLQDWGSDPSMSWFAFENDGVLMWYSVTLDSIGMPDQVATGQAYVAAGAYGGTFGDGSAAVATATWPCTDKPDIPAPTPLP